MIISASTDNIEESNALGEQLVVRDPAFARQLPIHARGSLFLAIDYMQMGRVEEAEGLIKNAERIGSLRWLASVTAGEAAREQSVGHGSRRGHLVARRNLKREPMWLPIPFGRPKRRCSVYLGLLHPRERRRFNGLTRQPPSKGPAMYRLIVALSICASLFFCLNANAQDIDRSRTDFARQIYASAANEVHHEAPQPLLRAVVVMRVRLSDEGRWTAEVLRENTTQPEMTRKALASVERMPAPAAIPESLRDELRRNGFVEAWLFQSDGRFALKTLALPQRDA